MNTNLEYLIIDVDGTMTDSGIYYDEHGNELKKFCTKDAAGFFAAKEVGIKIVVLTGRECAAVTRRMQEMKVDFLFQKVKDKKEFLDSFFAERGIDPQTVGYIGDDLNDYRPMSMVGFKACPANSCKEIKAISDYISPIQGGQGAVRDIIEMLLTKRGEWEKTIKKIYGTGI